MRPSACRRRWPTFWSGRRARRPETVSTAGAGASGAAPPPISNPMQLTSHRRRINVMPSTIDQVLDLIGNMTVMELSELKKAYEDKFGVTAAAPMMAMPAGGGGAAAVAEEKTEFDVVLMAAGDKKIQVIKVVREITGLGLKEAKDLVDGAPKPVKEKITKAEAGEMKSKLEENGASVEIR